MATDWWDTSRSKHRFSLEEFSFSRDLKKFPQSSKESYHFIVVVFEEVIVGNSPELMNDTKTQTEKKKKKQQQ